MVGITRSKVFFLLGTHLPSFILSHFFKFKVFNEILGESLEIQFLAKLYIDFEFVFSPPARWGLFPTCQVRVVRFYVSCLLLSSSPLLLLLLNRDPRRTVFSVGPQPRPSTPSVPCRTSTTTIPAQCSLPDLNHDHPRPVFPAGPQPRVSTPSVPCRTSCRKIWDKECAEES